MNELELAQAFRTAIKRHASRIVALLGAYDTAEFRRDLQLETSKYYTERVLDAHPFYASETRERVTREEDTYLLSDDDFARMRQYLLPLLYAHGLTDKNGNYTEDYTGIVAKARNSLVALIVPEQYRHVFADNIARQEKLISTIKKAIRK